MEVSVAGGNLDGNYARRAQVERYEPRAAIGNLLLADGDRKYNRPFLYAVTRSDVACRHGQNLYHGRHDSW